MATIIRAAPPPPMGRVPASSRTIGFPVLLAVALGYVMLMPPQLNIVFGSTSLPPFRFILIPSIALIVVELVRGKFAFRWSDLFVVLASFWVSLAMFMTTEAGEAFTAAFAQTTDMAVAYFFGRVTIKNLRDLRTLLVMMTPILCLIGIVMAIESLGNRAIIQPFFSSVTGRPFYYYSDVRFGLFRALGPFPHPILAGMFMASFLSLYLMSGLRGWPKFAGLIASFGGFFSMSSAALLALTSGLLLTAYNWISERILNLSWGKFLAAAATFVFVAEASGAGTYRMIIKYGSLNSSSAYNRIRIWQIGSDNVAKNPWFGLGYADWERPGWMSDSVDNFWLLLAMRFGVIVPFLVFFALAFAMVLLAKRSTYANPIDRRAYRGVAIALAVFAFGATSVALWGASVVWFFMLMGLAVSISSAPVVDMQPNTQSPAPILARKH
jgi:O-Antigen ligase